MKHLILLFFLGASFFANAQDSLLIYVDSLWKEVPNENATFYRKLTKNAWLVNDFYLSGQIQMSGTYKSKRLKKKQGHFIYYYENGQKESEGDFINNKKEGEWNYWYKTGKIDKKGNYVKNKYDKEWQFYFESGQISAKENYNKGKLVDHQFWNEDGSKVEGNPKAEEPVEFVGGQKAFQSYFFSELKYPKKSIEADFSGTVYIEFIIEIDGTITNLKVTKSLSILLDREVLRVITKIPKWKPGKQHNRLVRTLYVIPISFGLD